MANQDDETSPFTLLPEGCIANILSFTSPKDACRFEAVSFGFKSAADSDTVWERFLPPDYQNILARSSSPVTYSSKKELFFLLCDSPLLLDEGKLSFWLSKPSGKKCYMLCARELQIAWKDTPTYWKWTSLPESRFSEVAELMSVCWLEILGIIRSEMLSPMTNYAAYLVFKLREAHYGLDCSSKATIKFVKDGNLTEIEEVATSNVYIVPPLYRSVSRQNRWRRRPISHIDGRVPQTRSDSWMEIELGTFFNGEIDNDIDIHMQLLEGVNLGWKKGLVLQGIEVRPKE
ncbi:hypothetical protein ACJIZ3_013634 [Penstemon smallii]|uniref:F-box domain-containing protein n=1 Tax=Penstemon smallii TaxID=265156 RepID=A0ABD3RP09_9LAMI